MGKAGALRPGSQYAPGPGVREAGGTGVAAGSATIHTCLPSLLWHSYLAEIHRGNSGKCSPNLAKLTRTNVPHCFTAAQRQRGGSFSTTIVKKRKHPNCPSVGNRPIELYKALKESIRSDLIYKTNMDRS